MTVSNVLPAIAERYGISTKTLHKRIKEHPELGIVVESRRAPRLDDNQVAALCSILDKMYGRRVFLPTETPEAVSEAMESEEKDRRIRELSQRVSDLESEKAQLTTDLAVERARREGVEERLGFLVVLSERIPRLEEAAEARRAEAEELRGQVAEARANLTLAQKEAEFAREEWKTKGLVDRILRR